MYTIVWQGSVASDPELKANFDAAVDCVRQKSPDDVKATAYPSVVVIAEPLFTCYNLPDQRACTDYYATHTIYINQTDLYSYVFTHEVIHVVAQVGNDQHFKSYFSCAYYGNSFYENADLSLDN